MVTHRFQDLRRQFIKKKIAIDLGYASEGILDIEEIIQAIAILNNQMQLRHKKK